jgi:hypothetical protein
VLSPCYLVVWSHTTVAALSSFPLQVVDEFCLELGIPAANARALLAEADDNGDGRISYNGELSGGSPLFKCERVKGFVVVWG